MMKKIGSIIYILGFITLLIISVSFGSFYINPITSFKILVNFIFNHNIYNVNWDKTIEIVVINMRLSRFTIAFSVGALLALTGDITQKVTKNQLADTYILGVSSSVVFSNIILMTFNLNNIIFRIILSIILSLIVFFIINNLSLLIGNKKNSTVILIGISISLFLNSINGILLFINSNGNGFKNFIFWMMGSLEIYEQYVPMLLVSILISLILILFILRKEYEMLQLGEINAISSGMDYKKYEFIFLFTTVVITSIVVSLSGIIGYIGVIVPNLCRSIQKSKNMANYIFNLCFFGSFILIISDVLSKVILPPLEIPIGIITSAIGALFYIYYMVVNRI